MPNLDEELENMNNDGNDVSGEQPVDVNMDELLSDSEIERIANMKLDDIIEDATSSEISAADLFGEGSVENGETAQEVSSNDDSVEAAVEELQETDVDNNSEAQEDKSASKKSSKKKQNKSKKDKKGFFGAVKDIFFESIEEDEPDENIKGLGNGKELSEFVTDNPKDENERVLNEMYGKNGEAEVNLEQAAPKKGFFGKFKYRFEQFKKKSAEEDIAEQEAEEAEYEEKQRLKAEKKETAKQAKQEKAEAKAEAKAKKASKPKKEKPKKEKKPEEPPKPGDILRIKPKSVIKFILLISGIVILGVLLNTGFHYSFGIKRANRYLQNDSYEKAYEQLAGMELKDKDKDIYRQISVIMYVQRQYDSYENYMELDMRTEALNALVKGIQRYDIYCDEAKSLGVGSDVDAIKGQIVSALLKEFKISETEAKNLVKLSESNFTEYYLKIKAYGKA